ncbi:MULTISPECIES: DUF2158 domain-containing protein [Pseudomonas]|uniref:DUF2158 domain-containing protein n=1 Tax=Pseudomonas TaxID=286 RepID=UPI001E62B275|nr:MULTISPECIES: DUF2158 domain-containing protein [Pseudomonas]MCE1117677.1 DUF2158 domain-containing protein [Pseudomonas sp. NMI795_08]
MSEFFRGDVVLLKSGGPLMTIANIRQQRALTGFPATVFAFCQWFEGNRSMEKWFDTTTLEVADKAQRH